MKPLAIFAIAQNISEETKNRHSECIRLSDPETEYDLYHIEDKDCKDKLFNKSKHLNRTIKELYNQYEVMIQCDIDLIVPPGLVDKTFEIAMADRCCFYNYHTRVNPETLPPLPEGYDDIDWNSVYEENEQEKAAGCWNGMQGRYWIESCGFNEQMQGWGREDDDWRNRARRYGNIKFIDYNKFCLIHYNHPKRGSSYLRQNRNIEEKCIQKGIIDWLEM